MEHTKEPWKNNGIGIFDPEGVEIAEIKQWTKWLTVIPQAFANARRITAAVNACAGIPTDMLEEGLIKKAMADFEMMRVENERIGKKLMGIEIARMEADLRAKAHLNALKRIKVIASDIQSFGILEDITRTVDAEIAFAESGLTPTEQNCKGCFGPCGRCEEAAQHKGLMKAEPVNATVLQALIEVTNALQDLIEVPEVEAALYADVWSPVIQEAREVIEQAKDTYFPGLFIGTTTGIEDIDEVPKMKCEGECGEQGKCEGTVQKVEIYHAFGLKVPFEFFYCQKAIEEDESQGFRVKIITDVPQHFEPITIEPKYTKTNIKRNIAMEETPGKPDTVYPDEPDYDNQAKDYEEDQRWEGSPTPYDP